MAAIVVWSPPTAARVRSPPSVRPYSHRLLLSSQLLPKSLTPPPKTITLTLLHRRHRRFAPSAAATDGSVFPADKDSKLQQWDSITAKFAASANIPFLLLQLPQIVLNTQNLLAGNKSALFAVPWLGMLTGLLGNLSLLSYFAKKKETEAMVVQTLGVISTYVVIAQLAMAESMPVPHFAVTSAVVGSGLVLNFLNYFGWLSEGMWRLWEDFITVGGLSVLPQVNEVSKL